MVKLPVVSGDQAVTAFQRLGWVIHRRESSHTSMKREGFVALLTVPDHREIAPGTLRRLIRDAELTVAAFAAALKR